MRHSGSYFRRLLAPGALLLASVVAAFAFLPGAVSMASPSAAPPQGPVMIFLDNDNSANWTSVAKQAAQAYINALPANVSVGLIVFAASWQLRLDPTNDRSALETDVSGVQPAAIPQAGLIRSTGLYSGLASLDTTVPGFGATGSRIVIISCAENLTGPALSSTIPVDVIYDHLDSDDYVSRLQALAQESAGYSVTTAKAASLPTLQFPAPGTVPSLPSPPQSGAGATVRSAPAPLSMSLVAGGAGIFAAMFLIGLLAIGAMSRSSERRTLTGRIQHYGPRHAPVRVLEERDEADSQGGVTQAALSVVERAIPVRTQQRLARKLDLAASTRKPAEWALLGGCIAVVIAALFSIVTSYVLLGVLAGGLVGWLAMRFSLSIRIVRRRVAFAEQLPEALQLIASALQSGFSLGQALDAVIREDNQPIAGELSRALAESQLGANLDDGLESIAERMDSDDLRWTVMAIRIQQGVGGDLAEILLTIAATMRERAFLRRQVHSLSAEGRLSAYILVALPILVGGWLFFSDGPYMRPLYTTAFGDIMLTVSLVLIVVGALWMHKVIKVEV